MDLSTIFNGTLVVVSPLFAWFAFDKRKSRAKWGKLSLVLLALLGPILGLGQLALDAGLIDLGQYENQGLQCSFSCGRGLMLGVILSLAISGELVGRVKEREPNQSSEPTRSARGSS